jgi:hypothetical protein
MRPSSIRRAALIALPLLVVGCGVSIPPKLEVRDVSSGRTYQTYQPWGEVEKGVGYQFTDIETGRRINLQNYELRTLEGKKSVPGGSAEAQAYASAKTRGGVR